MDDLHLAIDVALAEIPRDCRLAEAIRDMLVWCCGTWEETWDKVMGKYGHYHPVHTINNACVVLMGCCIAAATSRRAISIAVMGGSGHRLQRRHGRLGDGSATGARPCRRSDAAAERYAAQRAGGLQRQPHQRSGAAVGGDGGRRCWRSERTSRAGCRRSRRGPARTGDWLTGRGPRRLRRHPALATLLESPSCPWRTPSPRPRSLSPASSFLRSLDLQKPELAAVKQALAAKDLPRAEHEFIAYFRQPAAAVALPQELGWPRAQAGLSQQCGGRRPGRAFQRRLQRLRRAGDGS